MYIRDKRLKRERRGGGKRRRCGGEELCGLERNGLERKRRGADWG